MSSIFKTISNQLYWTFTEEFVYSYTRRCVWDRRDNSSNEKLLDLRFTLNGRNIPISNATFEEIVRRADSEKLEHTYSIRTRGLVDGVDGFEESFCQERIIRYKFPFDQVPKGYRDTLFKLCTWAPIVLAASYCYHRCLSFILF